MKKKFGDIFYRSKNQSFDVVISRNNTFLKKKILRQVSGLNCSQVLSCCVNYFQQN